MEICLNSEPYYVGWFSLALINSCLAQIKCHMAGGKDFGGLAWFFLSLFLGPIATFIILVFKSPTNR